MCWLSAHANCIVACWLMFTAADSELPQVVNFLKGKGGYDAVRSILQDEASHVHIEFATLLSKSATILVNAGKHNRSGETWDPYGIVTKVANHPRWGQVSNP